MRIPTSISRHPVGFNMTPMIDIVFLLIIFFLVSSHLAQRESRIELDLPIASSGAESTSDELRRVTVNVLANGQTVIGGREMPSSRIAGYLLQTNQQADEPLEVRIRGDRLAPYEAIEPILKGAADAGIWDVTFSVVEEQAR